MISGLYIQVLVDYVHMNVVYWLAILARQKKNGRMASVSQPWRIVASCHLQHQHSDGVGIHASCYLY